ncbi:MAG: galactose oxidase-like domain-containing protein, partial [Methylotenera sp.]
GLPGSINSVQLSSNHPDAQVYSPAYLFNPDGSLATRPEIINAPNLVSYGRVIDVIASPDVNKFSMIKMSSTTHALNSDMRFLNVPFTSTSDGNYNLTLHTNPNVMTPGYWMLFALNAQGVPSVAKVIKVTTSNVPVLTNPGSQYSTVNISSDLDLHATDPNNDPLTFDAIGLPEGLSINSATGQITGIPVTTGSHLVIASVTDGINIVTANFVWNIVNKRTPVASAVLGNTTTGAVFSHSVGTDEVLTTINIRSSDWIDSIQAVLNTGALAEHGGSTGTAATITWPADEYLVRVYGLYGSSISQISF